MLHLYATCYHVSMHLMNNVPVIAVRYSVQMNCVRNCSSVTCMCNYVCIYVVVQVVVETAVMFESET